MRACVRARVGERACVLWTPISPHEILKGEEGDVRALGLAGDVS